MCDFYIFHMCLSKFEISSCAGIGWIDAYCVVELLDRFFIIAKLKQCHAEIIMRIGVCRIESHRLRKLLYRRGNLTHLSENHSDSRMGHRLIGLDSERELKFLDRFLLQSLLFKNIA